MYLVTIPTPDSAPTWLFFHGDPRQDGCRYPVVEVTLETFTPTRDEWTTEPEPHVLARLQHDPKRYRAFRSELDIHHGWEILEGHAEIWASWKSVEGNIEA